MFQVRIKMKSYISGILITKNRVYFYFSLVLNGVAMLPYFLQKLTHFSGVKITLFVKPCRIFLQILPNFSKVLTHNKHWEVLSMVYTPVLVWKGACVEWLVVAVAWCSLRSVGCRSTVRYCWCGSGVFSRMYMYSSDTSIYNCKCRLCFELKLLPFGSYRIWLL